MALENEMTLATALTSTDRLRIVKDLGGGSYGSQLLEPADLATYLASLTSGKRVVMLKVIDDATVLTTGDGKLHFFIPPELNGMNLVDADACISTVASAALPTIQIANVTDGVDMLSTRITIDIGEKTSYTAAAPPVIDTTKDDVVTGDQLRIDVDVAGTGAKGLIVTLSFQTP